LSHVRFAPRSVWSLAEARQALERMVGVSADLGRLDQYLIDYLVEPAMRATVMASSFASVLEMVREGTVDVHQGAAFGPIFLRKHSEDGATAPPSVQ
jgi:segregation and condensation protein A